MSGSGAEHRAKPPENHEGHGKQKDVQWIKTHSINRLVDSRRNSPAEQDTADSGPYI